MAPGQLVELHPRPVARAGPSARERWPVVAVALGIALLPFLNPKGPGHSAPVDPVLAAGIMTVLLWAAATRVRLHLPYVVPMVGLMLAGGLAAFFGAAPRAGALAVVQEIFLLAWCGAVVAVCRTPEGVRTLLRAWALSATAWASVLVVGGLVTNTALVTGSGEQAARASLLFDHPNMAGNYFMISVLVVVAAKCPRHRGLRAMAFLVLLFAMLLAGSNAAFASLVIGLLVTAFLELRRRYDPVRAVAGVLCLAALVGTTVTVAGEPIVTAAQQSENPLLRYSIGRGPRSAAARGSLFASQLDIYQRGDLLGIGPAATRATLGKSAASAVKEAHNDYLATLVERGPAGALALAVLVGAVGVRVSAVSARPLLPGFAAAVPVPGALAGAAAAFAFSAITHETLHYRHLWTLFGVVGALYLFGRAAPPTTTPVAARQEEPRPAGLRLA